MAGWLGDGKMLGEEKKAIKGGQWAEERSVPTFPGSPALTTTLLEVLT